ncbi:MAG TPA: tRNA pseudouridine(38-40) synthase TruA [Luteitalea sp.]|nr:tRNA pseudouridine(38-40) synthase TruA [Luteitalea sp.]
MPRFLLRLAYDGTAYAGWQRQENATSIQAIVEQALAPLAGGPVTVSGAGRTDAGVHADGQAAHVDLDRDVAPDVVVRAANARLPDDIRVRAADLVPDDFHARFSAVAKTYRYTWLVSQAGHPLLARTTCLAAPPLALPVMATAARALAGTHDFAAFQSTGTPVTSTVRTMRGVDFGIRPAEDLGLRLLDGERVVELELTADGFLRHMMRAIAGTLLEIGQGRRPVDDVRRLLGGAPRSEAGPNAPPQGLTLVRVHYSEDPPLP